MQKPHELPIRYVKGIGPRRAEIFARCGIYTVEDMLYYFPRRYEDRTKFSRISELKAGEYFSVKAKILSMRQRRSFRNRRFTILEVLVKDESGSMVCVWFNQPYLKEYMRSGRTVILYAKAELYGTRMQMSSPDFEIVDEDKSTQDAKETDDDSVNTGRIVPVYSLPEGMSQRSFRRLIKSVLEEFVSEITDFLPYDVRSKYSLLNLAKSLLEIHFPHDADAQRQAYKRLAFEEFFLFQLPLVLRKIRNKKRLGIAHDIKGVLAQEFIRSLSFELTSAQKNVVAEIALDMGKPQTMHRLLQGDVGSGKTIVATYACLLAIQGGYQAAFIVPTEILAKQHFEKISGQFLKAGFNKKIRIEVITGSTTKKKKEKIFTDIQEGSIDLIIGTHSLLDRKVRFYNLGLAVIDEQHKFGVGQRALLPEKGINPDILIMTATPIPRTLAITLYGDLDVSIIDELPPGRGGLQTLYFNEDQRVEAYSIVKQQLKAGNQAYIVYPLIEESYVLDIAGARDMYEHFKANEFKDFKLGLLHGRLKQKEQNEIMRKFKNKELDVLVATTVLEVGIDIPMATCMVVQHAQRFGLSQLHQLRGRVGRGKKESFCLLIAYSQTPESQARLEAMVKYNDGFRIAEEDLRIRGPGEFFGKRQHGLSDLKIANPLSQMHLLKRARDEAVCLLNSDPCLEKRQNILLKEKLFQRFPEYEKFIFVG